MSASDATKLLTPPKPAGEGACPDCKDPAVTVPLFTWGAQKPRCEAHTLEKARRKAASNLNPATGRPHYDRSGAPSEAGTEEQEDQDDDVTACMAKRRRLMAGLLHGAGDATRLRMLEGLEERGLLLSVARQLDGAGEGALLHDLLLCVADDATFFGAQV